MTIRHEPENTPTNPDLWKIVTDEFPRTEDKSRRAAGKLPDGSPLTSEDLAQQAALDLYLQLAQQPPDAPDLQLARNKGSSNAYEFRTTLGYPGTSIPSEPTSKLSAFFSDVVSVYDGPEEILDLARQYDGSSALLPAVGVALTASYEELVETGAIDPETLDRTAFDQSWADPCETIVVQDTVHNVNKALERLGQVDEILPRILRDVLASDERPTYQALKEAYGLSQVEVDRAIKLAMAVLKHPAFDVELHELM